MEYESTNINQLWLNNIFENLKKIEIYERLAREGCQSLEEYLSIPFNQKEIIIGDAQYKNLRLLFNEMYLVLPDLAPVIEKTKLGEFKDKLKRVSDVIYLRHIFITDVKDSSNKIKSIRITTFFSETLQYLAFLRQEIINSIADLLYLKDNRNT